MPDVNNNDASSDSTRANLALTRRKALVGAAWTAPAIVVAAAAPAFAASAEWTITSTSWEGTSAGVRNNSGIYQFRFSLTVPGTVTAPQAVFTFSGNGTTIAGVNPNGTVDGWSCAGSNTTGASAGAYKTFTFTRGTITGPAVLTLNFQMSDVAGTDVVGSTALFSSSSAGTGPDRSFVILATNSATGLGFITNPPG